MAKLYNLTRMSTPTVGSGTITLGAAVSGYLTFAQAGIQNGDFITYAIGDGASREIGRGIYNSTGPTLSRLTVLASTNSNNLISLSGAAQVMIAAAAEDFHVGDPQGRLTLTSGTPVMTPGGDVSAANTIYYSAYRGNKVPIYNGVKWSMETFPSDLSNTTTDATNNPAACAASSIYDLFVWLKAGALTLTRGPAWTSSTVRSMALTRVNGFYTNSASITNGPPASQGVFVGSMVTDASSLLNVKFGGAASGGSAGLLGVSNMFNRVRTNLVLTDNGPSYGYASATWRQWRNSAGNQHQFLLCTIEESAVDIRAQMHTISPGAVGAIYAIAVACDAISPGGATPSQINYHQVETAATINWSHVCAMLWNPSAQGFHTVFGSEFGYSTAPTFMADAPTILSVSLKW